MKKTPILFTLITSTLALGSIAALSLKQDKINKVEAGTIENAQMYVHVRNSSELFDGDTVIIACGNRTMLGVGANPVYTAGTYMPGGNDDYSKYYFESSDALTMKVGYDYNTGTYTFKSLKTAAEEASRELKTYGKYLSYANEVQIGEYKYRYTEDGHKRGTHGDLIFRSAVDEFSRMKVDFDDRGQAYIYRQNETNIYGEVDVSDIVSVKYSPEYNPSGNGHFRYDRGKSNVMIYRKVDLSKGAEIYVSKPGTKTHYLPNETADLNGVELQVRFEDSFVYGDPYICSYANEANYFTPLTATYDDQQVHFKWCGFDVSYSAEVNVPVTDENYFYKINHTGLKDARGTYLLGADIYVGLNKVTHLLDVSSIPVGASNADGANSVSLGAQYDRICDKNDLNEYIPEVHNNVFEIVYDTDGYYLKTNGKYLCGIKNDFYDEDPKYFLLYLGTREEAFKVRVGINGHLETVNGDYMTCAYKNSNKVYMNCPDFEGDESYMTLYKIETTSAMMDEMDTFKTSFFNKTATCDASGETNNLSLTDWNALSEEFNGLSLDSQGFIGCLEYYHNNEVANSFNDMADRYDFIVNKYQDAGFTDFMHRDYAGTMQNASNTINVNIINQNSSVVLVIAIISILSISSLMVAFILKRKHR